MLAKRIIPCLDIKNGRTVKGINFVDLRDAGDPVELGKLYSQQGADELVFLDITATINKRKTLSDLVKKIAKEMFLRILAQLQCIMRRKPTRSRKMSIGKEADATE